MAALSATAALAAPGAEGLRVVFLRLALVYLLLFAGTSAWTQPGEQKTLPAEVSEEALKAAFVYKFLAYAEWPSHAFKSATTPFVIGVIGADNIASELAQLVPGRTVNDRPVEVKVLKEGASLQGIHLLVVGELEGERLRQVLGEAQRHSVLTVTQSEGALSAGSIINFVMLDHKIRFEVSLEAAEKSRIRLSSRLLPVAYRVLPRKS